MAVLDLSAASAACNAGSVATWIAVVVLVGGGGGGGGGLPESSPPGGGVVVVGATADTSLDGPLRTPAVSTDRTTK